ncbi:hypothetical protein [Streptomyces sp. NPDC050355]|uniref:hypothetical protein n=1 Tax=Streptomyces sp. NPDC050355 TaxID=3365609 RepID=UPI0037B00017
MGNHSRLQSRPVEQARQHDHALGVVVNVVSPDKAFVYVTSVSACSGLWTWAMILVAHLRYRSKARAGLLPAVDFRMPGAVPSRPPLVQGWQRGSGSSGSVGISPALRRGAARGNSLARLPAILLR